MKGTISLIESSKQLNSSHLKDHCMTDSGSVILRGYSDTECNRFRSRAFKFREKFKKTEALIKAKLHKEQFTIEGLLSWSVILGGRSIYGV